MSSKFVLNILYLRISRYVWDFVRNKWVPKLLRYSRNFWITDKETAFNIGRYRNNCTCSISFTNLNSKEGCFSSIKHLIFEQVSLGTQPSQSNSRYDLTLATEVTVLFEESSFSERIWFPELPAFYCRVGCVTPVRGRNGNRAGWLHWIMASESG